MTSSVSSVVTDAIRLYGDRLSKYELTEILDYSQIWFAGLDAKKIEGDMGAAQNSGYDDDNGSYTRVGPPM